MFGLSCIHLIALSGTFSQFGTRGLPGISLLEIFHEVDESLYAFEGHGAIKRGTTPSYSLESFQVDKACSRCLSNELCLKLGIEADTERNIDAGTILWIHLVDVVALRGIDAAVEQR